MCHFESSRIGRYLVFFFDIFLNLHASGILWFKVNSSQHLSTFVHAESYLMLKPNLFNFFSLFAPWHKWAVHLISAIQHHRPTQCNSIDSNETFQIFPTAVFLASLLHFFSSRSLSFSASSTGWEMKQKNVNAKKCNFSEMRSFSIWDYYQAVAELRVDGKQRMPLLCNLSPRPWWSHRYSEAKQHQIECGLRWCNLIIVLPSSWYNFIFLLTRARCFCVSFIQTIFHDLQLNFPLWQTRMVKNSNENSKLQSVHWRSALFFICD